MRKIKILIYFILLVILINIARPVYADDELQEMSLTQEEIDKILEATVDLEKIPTINSRNAIVLDRTSRKNYIW